MKMWYILAQFISTGISTAICFLCPPVISYFLLALLFVRIIVFIRPTKGKKIQSFKAPKKALFVIDMQEAMCGKGGDYPTKEEFVQRANQFIAKAKLEGKIIIYICQEFPLFDFPFCFLAFGGRLFHGTKGRGLCFDMQYSGEEVFIKHQQDAFTSKKLGEYLTKNSINSVFIIGIDSTACVFKTALGAANRGYLVTVMKDGVLGKRAKATKNALHQLSKKGISVY